MLSAATQRGWESQAPFPMAPFPMRRLSPSTYTVKLLKHKEANATWHSLYFPCGNHTLELNSNEETTGTAHSFCLDFQGMHLWESTQSYHVFRHWMWKVVASTLGL